LYLMPEVQGEEYASFRAERAELQSVYGRLGRAAASAATGAGLDEVLTAALIMQVVESVIQMRRSGIWRDDYAHEIAASCLRLIGLDSDAVARARVGAPSLLNDVLGDLRSRARPKRKTLNAARGAAASHRPDRNRRRGPRRAQGSAASAASRRQARYQPGRGRRARERQGNRSLARRSPSRTAS
jgi:hypothetical protein